MMDDQLTRQLRSHGADAAAQARMRADAGAALRAGDARTKMQREALNAWQAAQRAYERADLVAFRVRAGAALAWAEAALLLSDRLDLSWAPEERDRLEVLRDRATAAAFRGTPMRRDEDGLTL